MLLLATVNMPVSFGSASQHIPARVALLRRSRMGISTPSSFRNQFRTFTATKKSMPGPISGVSLSILLLEIQSMHPRLSVKDV